MRFRELQAAEESGLRRLRAATRRSRGSIDYEAFCGGPAPLVSSARMHGRAGDLGRGAQDDARPGRSRSSSSTCASRTSGAISDLPDSVKIPLGTLPQSLNKLSTDDEIVVYCRTGGRSANAVQFLQQAGFEKVEEPRRRHQPLGRTDRHQSPLGTERPMRKVGLILLAVGLAGFLFASAQRAHYERAASAASSGEEEKSRRGVEAWETARWMILGAAVMGLVFTVLPGKES